MGNNIPKNEKVALTFYDNIESGIIRYIITEKILGFKPDGKPEKLYSRYNVVDGKYEKAGQSKEASKLYE